MPTDDGVPLSRLSRRRAILIVGTAAAFAGRPAHAATTLRVAYIPILAMAQLFVILGEGWAAQAGLDLQLTRFSSGPAMVQALASGAYQVAYIGIGPAMVARGAGLDLRVVAANGIDQGSLIGVGAFAAAFQAAASPAEAFAAFRQKNGRPVHVATLPKGSVPDTVLQYWLNEVAHVAPSDVQVLGVGEDRVQQVLLAGSAEAASALEPILTIVRERVPSARILVGGGDMFPNQPGAVLAMREAAIHAAPEAARSLVELHVRATKLILADPGRAARDTNQILGPGLVSEETLVRAFGSPAMRPTSDPHAIMEATARLGAYQVRLGTLARAIPTAELFDTSLYDALPPAAR